ncbi:HIT domain-containing protein, partial [Candidatus Latescibacteria bacterium]|nr:HIT domain-containing protein [Candidatus Latescibacterota bacterium]
MACPFCTPPAETVFFKGEYVYGMWEGYPIAEGHALLVPYRHVSSWFDATPEEQRELMQALAVVRAHVLDQCPAEAFNISINDGRAAGQTVDHLHVHLIPRYADDHLDSTDGVPHVIPGKANYLQRSPKPLSLVRDAVPGHSRLVTGEADPLLPRLHSYIRQATRADIAVAFLRQSGLNLISEHLLELLERGGELRLVTGDYLGITEPQALYKIYDWMQHP